MGTSNSITRLMTLMTTPKYGKTIRASTIAHVGMGQRSIVESQALTPDFAGILQESSLALQGSPSVCLQLHEHQTRAQKIPKLGHIRKRTSALPGSPKAQLQPLLSLFIQHRSVHHPLY